MRCLAWPLAAGPLAGRGALCVGCWRCALACGRLQAPGSAMSALGLAYGSSSSSSDDESATEAAAVAGTGEEDGTESSSDSDEDEEAAGGWV